MPLQTPGVYIEELPSGPRTIQAVATAVPAFIGHTAKADNAGQNLRGQPWRVASMLDFERCFGGAARPRLRLSLAVGAAPEAPHGDAPRGHTLGFAFNGRNYQLDQAAGLAGGRFWLHQALQLYFMNGGGPCLIVSVGDHQTALQAGDEHSGLIGGLAALAGETEHSQVLAPEAVLLSEPDCIRVQQALLQHGRGGAHRRMAILDVWGGDRQRADGPGSVDCINRFREHIGLDHLGCGAAYYPWLHTNLPQTGVLGAGVFDDHQAELQGLIATDLGLPAGAVPGDADIAQSALLAAALDQANQLLNLMPPSALLAGIYAQVDNHQGVWKAPTNISLNGVLATAVAIDNADQEDLNISLDGKSVNALRSFVGRGILVWGARTLDGNSNEARYINVRRTLNMIEDSCQRALQALSFEPNTAPTWLMTRAQLENFLFSLWRQGALFGAKPEDAYAVRLGLGQTMTQQDLQDGLLKMELMLALVRPAEFVVVRIAQNMQAG
jgi:hypothetical protein